MDKQQTYCLKTLSESQTCDKPCNFRRVCVERFNDYIYNNLSGTQDKKENSYSELSNHQIILQKN